LLRFLFITSSTPSIYPLSLHDALPIFARVDAIPSKLQLPGVRAAEQMHVVVDEPGNDRSSPEIDPPGVRSRQLRHLLIGADRHRSEEHTSELQSPDHLVCRLLLEKKNK